MKIWITRHGQTRLNREKRWQGRLDEPLNETGIRQAHLARKKIGDVTFDKVYSSPLRRAVVTASIIGAVGESEITIDPRVIEADFGKYEGRPYSGVGPAMTLYWASPTVFPAPKTVETVPQMVSRVTSFLNDIEAEGQENHYENVLVACHGGIMRVLSGCLLGRRNGLLWRPRPQNCEIRVFDGNPGKHAMLADYLL